MTDQTTAPLEPAAPAGLTVNDLTLTLQVIQIAANRGAFKAEELTAVGGLYDRVFKFLESSGAIQKSEAAPPTDIKPTAKETE